MLSEQVGRRFPGAVVVVRSPMPDGDSQSCTELCQCSDCQNPFALPQQSGNGSSGNAAPSSMMNRSRSDLSTIPPVTVPDPVADLIMITSIVMCDFVQSIRELTREMVLAAQRLSDQEAAHDLLTLSFQSPAVGLAKRARPPDQDTDEAPGPPVPDPPSPSTALLLCYEEPDAVNLAPETSELYRQQELAILMTLDSYFNDFVAETLSNQSSQS